MAIVSYITSNQITPIAGYDYVAELQWGTNGEMWGAPELDAGSATSRSINYSTWDPYVDDGIETGWLNTSYRLKSGASGLSLYANGAPGLLTYDVGTISGIGSIKIRTGVQNQSAMLLRLTQVRFFRGDTLQETINLAESGVDKTEVAGGDTAEQIITVQPAHADNTRVTVDTQFRMVAPAGVWLNSYDVFTQVFAFTGSGGQGQSQSQSMLGGTTESLLESEPMTSVAATGKYTGDTFSVAPLSSSSDELLGVVPVPDLFASEDPLLL